MEKEFIEKMQAKLIEQRNKILASAASQNNDLKKIVENVETGDVVDQASDVVDGQLLESVGAANANRLTMISNALDRIRQGTYGKCLSCGKDIPEERLESVPEAFLCIACKSREELRNR